MSRNEDKTCRELIEAALKSVGWVWDRRLSLGPACPYTLKQAIKDGYLVPCLLEERITNVDADGFSGPDGRQYSTGNFEREAN
jgi:type I site-specific restriction endonuclease